MHTLMHFSFWTATLKTLPFVLYTNFHFVLLFLTSGRSSHEHKKKHVLQTFCWANKKGLSKKHNPIYHELPLAFFNSLCSVTLLERSSVLVFKYTFFFAPSAGLDTLMKQNWSILVLAMLGVEKPLLVLVFLQSSTMTLEVSHLWKCTLTVLCKLLCPFIFSSPECSRICEYLTILSLWQHANCVDRWIVKYWPKTSSGDKEVCIIDGKRLFIILIKKQGLY